MLSPFPGCVFLSIQFTDSQLALCARSWLLSLTSCQGTEVRCTLLCETLRTAVGRLVAGRGNWLFWMHTYCVWRRVVCYMRCRSCHDGACWRTEPMACDFVWIKRAVHSQELTCWWSRKTREGSKKVIYELFKNITTCRHRTRTPMYSCIPVMYEMRVVSSCGLIGCVTSPIDRQ